MPWYSPRMGPRVFRHRSSSVSCCSKNSPALNCSIPRRSSDGGASVQRVRAGSSGAPGGCRFGGRADLRERLLGSGVLGPDDLAVAELVLDELADEVVLERFGKIFRPLGVGDLDSLVEIVGGDQVTLRELVQPRVLKVPDGPRLTDRSTGKTDDARFLPDDLRVLADLALRGGALVLGDVGGQGELGDFASHVAR